MQITDYHAKYFAYELTRQRRGCDVGRISQSLFEASVDLNPHQIDAASFALSNPLIKGVVLADEVGLGCPITENSKYLPNVNDDIPQGSYLVTLDRVRHQSLATHLDTIRNRIAAGDSTLWNGKIEDGLEFLWCERHFYQPLLAAAQGLDFQVTPESLNKGERDFVKDIQQAYEAKVFDGYDIYLLRNQTGQGAVGVFIDGGFNSDFILWLVKGDEQNVIFIDPKGLLHHKPEDPKVRFFQTIKDIEADLRKQNPANNQIELHAFLVSGTHSSTLISQWKDSYGDPVTRELLDSWNILFRNEEQVLILGSWLNR